MTSDTPESPSRRRVVTGMAAGLMAGVAAPALAQQQQQQQQQRSQQPPGAPVNPLTAYPRPPYPAQQQPWPGLASKMEPRPDHGETSYRGSGRLAGRKALITGGDSGMGRAAAIAYAREGADGHQLPAG